MENINELKKILSIPRNIVITTHRNPDGDAIGSSLGLYHFLNEFGHTVRIIVPSEFPEFLNWLPHSDRIIIFDIDPDEPKELLQKADIIFCLDYNSLERVDKMGEIIAPLKCPKVLIDHHLYPENFADFVLSETNASSTSELIYDFVVQLGEENKIETTIGECLFTGILTDTGSFKYGTSSKLFCLAGKLLALGVDDGKLQDLIFNSLSEKNLRLLGHVLNNRMEILDEYETGIISLTKEDYENFDIQRGDTEGLVNYLLKLKNIKVAVFIHEQPKITKISLRSKGDFSVQEIARDHFKGGGHRNAAGGFSYIGLRPTVKKFKSILPEYKEAIARSKS